MKYSILLSDSMHSAGTDQLSQKYDLLYSSSKEDFIEKAKIADALILIRNGEAFRNTIETATRLKVIAKHGVGLDKIDLAAAKERNIPVVYTPDSNSIGVAEHFVTLCLMCAKKMHKGDLLLRKGKWKHDPFDFLGTELFGKTIGILGFGRIGRHVARICHEGFNMQVRYFDVTSQKSSEQEFDAVQLGLNELFSVSDFISINLPFTSETRGLVNAELLRKMKPSAYIINMARGPIWKETDVLQALKEKWIAGAASDVFESEPTREDNPLLGMENFIGTPHNAAHTEESMKRASLMLAQDISAVFEGRSPKYPVPDYMYPKSDLF